MPSVLAAMTPGSKSKGGGFGKAPIGKPAGKKPATEVKPTAEELAAKEREAAKARRAQAEKKERDEVNQLKERLSKGHRLNDQELAQLEMAAVARWNQLQREDEEEAERQRELEAEKERKREQRLQKELVELRQAAAADRANLERAGAAVADELRELRELRDAAAADRANLESSVAAELRELRELRDTAERDRQRKLAAQQAAQQQEQLLLSSIYDADAPSTPGGGGSFAATPTLVAPRGPSPPRGAAASGYVDVEEADIEAGGRRKPSSPEQKQAPAAASSPPKDASPDNKKASRFGLSRGKKKLPKPPPQQQNGPAGPGTAGASGAQQQQPPPPPAPPPPVDPTTLDPETRLRLMAFEEYATEMTRKAELAGEGPPHKVILEDGWTAAPRAMQMRFERIASQKLKKMLAVEAAIAAGGDPSETFVHCAANEGAGARGRSVDFGRMRHQPEKPPPKRKKVVLPPAPTGSALADALSLLALLCLLALLATRTWVCAPTDRGWRLALSKAANGDLSFALGGVGVGGAGADVNGKGRWLLAQQQQQQQPGIDLAERAQAVADKAGEMAEVAAERAQAASSRYASALSAELSSSCGDASVWAQQGRGMMHGVACLIAIVTLVTLFRQLLSRCRAGRAAAADKAPLLPVAAPAPASPGGAPASAAPSSAAEALFAAPWTSLACAELFLAAYAASDLLSPRGGKATSYLDTSSHVGKVWTSESIAQSLLGAPTATHLFVLGCALLLLLAATRRALQVFLWHRAVAAALAPPPPPPPKPAPAGPKTPKAKTAAELLAEEKDAKRRGGRGAAAGAKTPSKEGTKRQLFASVSCCAPLQRMFGCLAPPPPPMPPKGGRAGSKFFASKAGGRRSMV